MFRFSIPLVSLFGVLAAALAPAQSVAQRPYIRASGVGVISIMPDQLMLQVGSVTQGLAAEEATSQNAALVSKVLSALRQLLGPGADIKTVSYAVTPNYRYPQAGGQPVLTGYTATNTVEVTSLDLSIAGKIIDTATQAGATTVTGLRFSLRDPEPVVQRALRAATIQAKAHAEAIAQGLGVRLGGITAAEEGSTIRPVAILADTRAAAATPTPIEPGALEVHASVAIEMEIIQ